MENPIDVARKNGQPRRVYHGVRLSQDQFISWRTDFHTVALSSGSDASVWTGPFRFIPATILPMFFALSGFLVTGSLLRVPLHQFITLRLARLIPALAVEITLTALIIGSIFTTLPLQQYFTDPMFYAYFLNIVGNIHYILRTFLMTMSTHRS